MNTTFLYFLIESTVYLLCFLAIYKLGYFKLNSFYMDENLFTFRPCIKHHLTFN